MIRLYIFDQGGLVTRSFDIVPEAARLLGVEASLLRGLLMPDMAEFMAGKFREAEVWRRLEARSGIAAKREYWAELYEPGIDRPTFDLIDSLRRPGVRVVCGTNTIASHYEKILVLGHLDCFDAVYASHLIGLAKPDPEFWLHILKREGVEPGECFFADDMKGNVDAAAALGIHAALFTGADALARRIACELEL